MSFQKIISKPVHQGQPELEIKLQIPKTCPICGTGNRDLPINAYHIYDDDDFTTMLDVYAEYYCPKCTRIYFAVSKGRNMANSEFRIYRYSNGDCNNTPIVPEEVTNVSAKFSKIYSQAFESETKGLDELTGIGFRKALEYLVKDYSIYKYPKKESEIRKAALASCINSYIDSSRIKNLAKACAWLGNDETHYERKHENYSIKDIKAFLEALVAFIKYDILADKATEFISSSHAKRPTVPDNHE